MWCVFFFLINIWRFFLSSSYNFERLKWSVTYFLLCISVWSFRLYLDFEWCMMYECRKLTYSHLFPSQAYLMRPSITFFDEIDGLAPVRSSRQDQIHSSIVSTLLALMDGLDSRGEIVIIGATNRIDSIDPALRRPGRFDREFSFPLPSQEVRTNHLKR